MTFKNQHKAYFNLRGLTTLKNESQDFRGYWTKVHQILAVVIFSSTVLTQQSALRSVHQLLNERGDIKKTKVTSVKHKLTGGIAMPGGLISPAVLGSILVCFLYVRSTFIFNPV